MKNVVLGITGSIAAYKACDIISRLKKQGVNVRVILTRAGAEFITPLALETISSNPVVTDMFNRETPWEVEHISLAKGADVFLVAPASANFMAKAALGIADDMLTTTLLATRAPVIVAPAMNSNMYTNSVVQQNMATLKHRGFRFVDPAEGLLACGDSGIGRLAEVDDIVAVTMQLLYPKRDFEGVRVLVTAGPTQESLDPVRYLTNRSSGKMGYAIAEAAASRGATVTLVSGPTALPAPDGVELIQVKTSADMYQAVNRAFESCDVLLMAAAPADFTVDYSEQKIKKSQCGLSLKLVPTQDILASLKGKKGSRIVVGFAAETQNLGENAEGKLERKGLDMIAANDVSAGKVFGREENCVVLIKHGGERESSGVRSKREVAHWLLDEVAAYKTGQ